MHERQVTFPTFEAYFQAHIDYLQNILLHFMFFFINYQLNWNCHVFQHSPFVVFLLHCQFLFLIMSEPCCDAATKPEQMPLQLSHLLSVKLNWWFLLRNCILGMCNSLLLVLIWIYNFDWGIPLKILLLSILEMKHCPPVLPITTAIYDAPGLCFMS